MSSATKRIFLQGIPLACLILAGGLARQYASGAGVFDPSGTVAKAQELLANLPNEVKLLPAQSQIEPTVANAPLSADVLQGKLAGQVAVPAPAVLGPLPAASDPFFFGQPAFGHCRH